MDIGIEKVVAKGMEQQIIVNSQMEPSSLSILELVFIELNCLNQLWP